MPEKYPHINAANRYARAVVREQIPACHWVRAACQRHLDDLDRAKKKGWPFRFDKDAAERVCQIVELFPHIKGKWAGTPIVLEPWQKFVLCAIFGWVRKADGLRRFQFVYIEVPRKNAKSTLSAAVALVMAFLDGEGGAEAYSAATTRDQARIVFETARLMVKRSRRFRERFGVEAHAHAISQDDTASKFEPLSAEGSTLDGLNVHMAVVDELHAHKNRSVFDALDTGMGARSQPLLWSITTAGHNRAGICYQQRSYVTKVLNGAAEDETVFGIIYTIDEGDDPFSAATWKKANPNYGVSVDPDDMDRLARRARENPSDQVAFLTKRLNVWVNASQAWMNMVAWEDCGQEPLALEDFEGEPCWMGLDLASRVDVAALLMVWRRGEHYYALGRYYLPEDAVAERSHETTGHYWGWAQEGRLTLTPGNVIDFNAIEDDIRELAGRFDTRAIAYDPWQATQLATELQDEGLPMVEVRASTGNFSEPMKELEALVKDRRFEHGGCPVLEWMVSNVVAHYDNKDNIYPRKETPENKIDGVVALIMALGRALSDTGGPSSVYEERGLRRL